MALTLVPLLATDVVLNWRRTLGPKKSVGD
jgi:hypothetical protein